jgi:hypothetical protein
VRVPNRPPRLYRIAIPASIIDSSRVFYASVLALELDSFGMLGHSPGVYAGHAPKANGSARLRRRDASLTRATRRSRAKLLGAMRRDQLAAAAGSPSAAAHISA